jgi:hypothetical protein
VGFFPSTLGRDLAARLPSLTSCCENNQVLFTSTTFLPNNIPIPGQSWEYSASLSAQEIVSFKRTTEARLYWHLALRDSQLSFFPPLFPLLLFFQPKKNIIKSLKVPAASLLPEPLSNRALSVSLKARRETRPLTTNRLRPILAQR